MAIFTNPKSVTASIITESFDEVIATAIKEGIEYTGMDMDEMAIGHVVESEENFNKIMMAIGIHEATVYAESGEEVVYTEGTLSDIKDKIVSFIKSVWNKIVGLFKRFMSMIDSWTKDDKEFLKKYKGELVKRAGKLKDFTFNGYKFTIGNKPTLGIAHLTKKVTEVNADSFDKYTDEDQTEDNYTDIEEKERGELLAAMGGSSGTYTASEFSKELFELFRNGESSKTELENIDITSVLGELEGSKTARKEAEKAFKDAKRICDDFIKEIERTDKTTIKSINGKDKDTDKNSIKASKILNHKARLIRMGLSALQTINGAHLTALKDQSRQNKAICVKIMSSVKAEAAGSWEYEIEEGTSFLSNVKFN